MKILLIGGSGMLGSELLKLHPEIVAPSSNDLNICIQDNVYEFIDEMRPDIIINAAAMTDNRLIEKDPASGLSVNIIGSALVAMAALEYGSRYIYISTDYIYKGDRGNYKETDEILPFNLYSWTKLGGECSAVAIKNHLIIRTSFGKNSFDYPEAFTDKWTSKDYVDVIAPMIYEAAISPLTGVLNLGTDRKNLFFHATERNDNVLPVKLEDRSFFTPVDTSLNLQKWFDYQSSNTIAKPHSKCRCCGSLKLTKYLDLGLMPLANNLEFTAKRAKDKERFPLQVLFCEDCSLSQLSVVIDPEKMFSYYTYRSSVNGGYVKHCAEMAIDLREKYNLDENSFHVDIAGNDGALLKQFKDVIGLKTLNIDPATNLVAIAEAQGIESIADFWSLQLAEKTLNEKGGADLITATNVFAHVDNVKDFILASKILLKPEGVLVLEFPYLVDFIENMEFDTIYFEHLSYFSILPLNRLCEITGMNIVDVEKKNIHGGTVRVTITHNTSSQVASDRVLAFAKKEIFDGYNTIEKYSEWSEKVKGVITEFGDKILALKKSGMKVAAFAASAKGNTLLNSAGVNTDLLSFIADETPEKIGKFSPGTGIPIVNKQEITKNPPDYLVILSWNFQQEIMAKLDKFYTGKYIIPIPEFKVVGE